MPKNIEMNVKQQDGSYEVIYPKTVTENVYNSSGQTVDQIMQQNTEDVLTVFKGIIVMWSGSQSNIPSGWVLCDGNNGTPDLRNRFIVGAGSTYGVNSTGGEATHTLSVAEMPSHGHNASLSDSDIFLGIYGTEFSSSTSISILQGETWPNMEQITLFTSDYKQCKKVPVYFSNPSISTSNTGSSQPHNNLPPYYALCYIMKT